MFFCDIGMPFGCTWPKPEMRAEVQLRGVCLSCDNPRGLHQDYEEFWLILPSNMRVGLAARLEPCGGEADRAGGQGPAGLRSDARPTRLRGFLARREIALPLSNPGLSCLGFSLRGYTAAQQMQGVFDLAAPDVFGRASNHLITRLQCEEARHLGGAGSGSGPGLSRCLFGFATRKARRRRTSRGSSDEDKMKSDIFLEFPTRVEDHIFAHLRRCGVGSPSHYRRMAGGCKTSIWSAPFSSETRLLKVGVSMVTRHPLAVRLRRDSGPRWVRIAAL